MKALKNLMFGAAVAALALSAGTVTRAQGKDIVDTAVAAGQFKTLAAALQAAGLVETLKGAGPFTVFAPTDEAFAKLPKGTLEDLLKPENKAKLTAILTYHVVPGKVMAADVVKVKRGEDRPGRLDQGLDDGRRRDGRQRPRGEDRHRGVERRHPRHRRGHPAEDAGDQLGISGAGAFLPHLSHPGPPSEREHGWYTACSRLRSRES